MLPASATVAWQYLDGIVCLYKPAISTMNHVRKTVLFKLCQDLNSMKCRDIRKRVDIVGDTSKPLTVRLEPNYADHPLVVGPRYIEKDFRMLFVNYLGVRTSGVVVAGINGGTGFAQELRETKPLNVYHVKAQLGLLTDTSFIDGKPRYKCNYEFITRDAIDRVVAGAQATHQKLLLSLTGVNLQSQEAYELASGGLIRPRSSEAPVIYNIKCIDVKLPEFTLEIAAVNENEDYLVKLIFDIGYRLKNVASIVSIRCIRVSFFTLEHAMLKKHWNLENVLGNMRKCYETVQQNDKMEIELQEVKDSVSTNVGNQYDVEVIDEDTRESCEKIDDTEHIKEIN